MHAEDLATAPAASSSAVVSNRASPSRVAAQALAQPSGIRNKKLGWKLAFHNCLMFFFENPKDSNSLQKLGK